MLCHWIASQESCALQSALDVGHERGRNDDDLAAVRGDELEEVVDAVDDFDATEALLDLRSGHSNLCVKVYDILAVSQLELGRFLKIRNRELLYFPSVHEIRNCELENDFFSMKFFLVYISVDSVK